MNETTMMGGNTMSNTQENTLATELFLQDNYLFRRNVLSGKVAKSLFTGRSRRRPSTAS